MTFSNTQFKKGDKAVIDGVGVVTILSWPAQEDGYVYWEQVSEKTGAQLQRTDHLSTITITPADEPAPAPVVVTDEVVADLVPDVNTEATLADPVAGQDALPVES